jgi:hypothetical protein
VANNKVEIALDGRVNNLGLIPKDLNKGTQTFLATPLIFGIYRYFLAIFLSFPGIF